MRNLCTMLEGKSNNNSDLGMTRLSNESIGAHKDPGFRQSFTASNVSNFQDNESTSLFPRRGSSSMIEIDKENLLGNNFLNKINEAQTAKMVTNLGDTFGKFTTLNSQIKGLDILGGIAGSASIPKATLTPQLQSR